MVHVRVPLAAVMTKVTFAPAVSVMLAPLVAVAVTLLLVGPKLKVGAGPMSATFSF